MQSCYRIAETWLAEHNPDEIWWNGFTQITRQLLAESGVAPQSIAGGM